MSDWQAIVIMDAPVPVDRLFVYSGLVPSLSAARRVITQGGAYLNNTRVTQDQHLTPADLLRGRYVILRRGKRDIGVIEVLRAGEDPAQTHASCVLMPVPEEVSTRDRS